MISSTNPREGSPDVYDEYNFRDNDVVDNFIHAIRTETVYDIINFTAEMHCELRLGKSHVLDPSWAYPEFPLGFTADPVHDLLNSVTVIGGDVAGF